MYKRILVPVDGSGTSRRGLEEALKLAKSFSAEVRLVHVVNELIPFGADQMYYNLPSVMESLREQGKRVLQDAQATADSEGLKVETNLIEAIGPRAADLIVNDAEAWRADLIVMGTHGRRGLGRWALGSDAEQVLRTATSPVLLVRAPL